MQQSQAVRDWQSAIAAHRTKSDLHDFHEFANLVMELCCAVELGDEGLIDFHRKEVFDKFRHILSFKCQNYDKCKNSYGPSTRAHPYPDPTHPLKTSHIKRQGVANRS